MAGQQRSIRNHKRANRCLIFALFIWNFGFLALLVLPAISSEVGAGVMRADYFVILESLFVPWVIGAIVLSLLVLVSNPSKIVVTEQHLD